MGVAGVLQEARHADIRVCSSILTLLQPLDSLICDNDIMVIVVLLQMMGVGGCKVGGWFIYVRVWVGQQRFGYHIFLFFWCFCAVVNCCLLTGA